MYLPKLSHHFKVVIFTILFMVLFPVTVVLFSPIYIFRFILSYVIKFLRPDLHSLVATRSTVLATDSPYDKPNWNLCVWLVLDGKLNIDVLRENFYSNIVLKKWPNGNLVNPQYQQYITRWMGFLFWKWEKKFDMFHHIRPYFTEQNQDSRVNSMQLKQIIKELTWAPFEAKKSPWEFLFIPHYISSERNFCPKKSKAESVLILRVHHGICDGFTILRLLMEEVNNISLVNVAKPSRPKLSMVQQAVNAFFFWIRGPYMFMKMMAEINDNNAWHLPKEQLTRPKNTDFTPRISLEYIKGIKRANEVSFSAVLIAAITGAIRRMMIRKNVRIPPEITVAFPLPIPRDDPENLLRNLL